jgi:ATP-dependent Lon protease
MITTMAAAGPPKFLCLEDKQRLGQLVELCEREDALFKRHLIADTAMIRRLETLDAQAAGFSEATRLIIRAAHLSCASGLPIRVPPLLLLGSPGTGKSRYAAKLAKALNTTIEIIAGTTIPDIQSLLGYGKVWRGASVGRICKTLIAAPNSAPMLFIDEVEKIQDRDAPNPANRLLTLLEPHTAAAFRDEFLMVPMRADRVIWLMAANTLEGLSDPFLDRVVVIEIRDLTRSQRHGVLRTMMKEVTAELGIFLEPASDGVFSALRDLPLRRARLALELGVASAVTDGRRMLIPGDVTVAADLLDRERPAIGFVRH